MNKLELRKKTKNFSITLIIFLLLVLTFVLHRVSQWAPPPPILNNNKRPDVWYHYRDSKLIYEGINPYILWEMDPNNNPLSYFPLFNLIGVIPMYLGFTSYDQWTNVMRILYFSAELGIGIFLFELSKKVKKPVLGLLGAGTWFFNLATLKVWEIQQTDNIVIFLALLGVYCLEKNPDFANIILGISMGIKQITMFLIPLFLLVQVRMISEQKTRRIEQIVVLARALFLISIINLITSLPFLLMDYKNFFRGFLNEGVGNPTSHTYLTSGYHRVYYLIFLHDLPTPFLRIPLFCVILGLYLTYFKQRYNKYLFSSIVFLTYIYFSPIVFEQYFVWPIPFILVPIIENVTIKDNSAEDNKKFVVKTSFEAVYAETHQSNFKKVINRLKYCIRWIKNVVQWRMESIILVTILITIVTALFYYTISQGQYSNIIIISLLGYIGVALLIYGVAVEYGRSLLGLFSAAFWLFNPAAILALQRCWWAHPILLFLMMIVILVESHSTVNAFRFTALAATIIFYFIHFWSFLWIDLIGLIAIIILYTIVENVNSPYEQLNPADEAFLAFKTEFE